MVRVREAVYDGHLRGGGELLDRLVVEGADHDGVYVAGEDAAGVRRGLALAHLYLLGGEGEGVAAELVHAYLERDAGTVGGLLEDHGERPAAQGAVGDAALLHGLDLDGLVQDQAHLPRRELRQRQAVPAREGGGLRRDVVYLRDHGHDGPYATAASGTATLIAARTPLRKVSSAARTSVLVTVSGGANRMVVPPTKFTSRPSSKQCSKTDRARSGSLRSMPISSPSPLTSAPGTRSARTCSAALRTSPP